jgi:hypothetical protein
MKKRRNFDKSTGTHSTIKVTDFGNVAPISLVDRYRRFGET